MPSAESQTRRPHPFFSSLLGSLADRSIFRIGDGVAGRVNGNGQRFRKFWKNPAVDAVPAKSPFGWIFDLSANTAAERKGMVVPRKTENRQNASVSATLARFPSALV
jgi:hypothetical protein